MRRFELVEPASLADACALLAARHDARAIAGGTALLILIKQGVYFPTLLVNLKKVRGADAVTYDERRGLRIGALTSIYDVETAPAVRAHYPLLATAAHQVANIRIRNLATIGGNLAHADYQSDPPTALVALGARVELTGPRGTREVPLHEFLVGAYETTLEPGELLSAVLVPPPPAGRGTYVKFTTGSSEDRPCAGIAALVQQTDGVIDDLRLVVGAVSPVPVRVDAAAELARGERPSAGLFERIGALAAAAIEPIEDLHGPADYKRHLVRVLVARAVETCTSAREARQ